MKVVCFSKRITEIISSLYLFISKEGRTPLSPEPRSVARVQPSPDPAGGVPAQPRPCSPRRAHLCPRTDTTGGTSASQSAAGRQVTPRAARRATPGAAERVTNHPGGRGTSHPRGRRARCPAAQSHPRSSPQPRLRLRSHSLHGDGCSCCLTVRGEERGKAGGDSQSPAAACQGSFRGQRRGGGRPAALRTQLPSGLTSRPVRARHRPRANGSRRARGGGRCLPAGSRESRAPPSPAPPLAVPAGARRLPRPFQPAPYSRASVCSGVPGWGTRGKGLLGAASLLQRGHPRAHGTGLCPDGS